MVKFFKNAKGHFFVEGQKVGKTEFLRTMVKNNRLTYIKESKTGKFYYYRILKSEIKFESIREGITAKIKILINGDSFYIWDFVVTSEKRGKKPSAKSYFYAIETDSNIIVYENNEFKTKEINKFDKLIKKMLDIVKKEYKLKDVYCRAVVSVIYTLEPKEENKEKPISFERKYSSKGYTYELVLEKIFTDLINKMLFGQSIISIEFTNVNLLCIEVE